MATATAIATAYLHVARPYSQSSRVLFSMSISAAEPPNQWTGLDWTGRGVQALQAIGLYGHSHSHPSTDLILLWATCSAMQAAGLELMSLTALRHDLELHCVALI